MLSLLLFPERVATRVSHIDFVAHLISNVHAQYCLRPPKIIYRF